MSFISDFVVRTYYSTFFLGNEHLRAGECQYSSIRLGEEPEPPKMMQISELPEKRANVLRVVSISDTHERHGSMLGAIPKGDLFLHTGDILMSNSLMSSAHGDVLLRDFNEWLAQVPCTHRVIIAGNHDYAVERLGKARLKSILTNALYIENEMIVIESLRIWGSPLSNGTSHNRAFQSVDFERETLTSASQIEQTPHIVLTHGPCHHLVKRICAPERGLKKPLVHFWGHLHGFYGTSRHKDGVISVNSCIMDGRYDLANAPIVIDIDRAFLSD
jgi:predicted phosphohydrolase